MFTMNNWTEEGYSNIMDMQGVTFMVVGKEIAPTTGTPHLQGVVTFKKAYTRKQVLNEDLLAGCHVDVPKYLNAVRKYCQKDGDYKIVDNKQQGKRTDMEKVADLVKEGKSLRFIANKHPCQYMRYSQGINSLMSIREEPRTKDSPPPKVYWFYGDTGTGKSRYVMHHKSHETDNATSGLYVHNGDFKFLNGYENQQCVLFDDFRETMVQWSELLSLLDRYPRQVNVKGGHKNWNPTEIYITSSLDPRVMYATANEDRAQLFRRIDAICEFRREVVLGDGVGAVTIKAIKGDFPFHVEDWE